MKTKEEVIKESWGVHYANDIDEFGWRESNVGSLVWDANYFDIMKKDDDLYVIRPKSLNGISNNNGWIKIESEEDLPKLMISETRANKKMYDACFYDGISYFVSSINLTASSLKHGYIDGSWTHYKESVNPLKPLY